jgi:anthranilate synthase component II
MILLLDNYDSFTYNLYQLLSALGAEVEVVRNDCMCVESALIQGYDAVVISPGPGMPGDAGITETLIEKIKGKIPILGICLGHQAIGETFGARVIRAKAPVHGKTSLLHHAGDGSYEGIPQNIEVARYHSLILERASLPDALQISAELADGTIMGIRHREYDIEGMQFHPESILTPQGYKLMSNFLQRIAS